MTDTELVPPTTAPTKDAGLSFRGLVEVFYKPSVLFTKLRDNPKVLVPYLAVAVLASVCVLATMNLMYSFASSMPQYQEQVAKSPLTPSQMETFTKWGYVISMSLAYVVQSLLTALLALFWGNFVYAGRAKYSQLLSIFLYAEFIYVVGMVARLALQLPTGNILTGLSLYVVAPGLPYDGFMGVLLQHISVFYIWEIVAAAVGMSVVYGFSRSKGYVISLLSVGLFSIVPILWVGIKSIF